MLDVTWIRGRVYGRLDELKKPVREEDFSGIDRAVARAEEWFLNELNREEIPSGLRYAFVDYAAGLFLAEQWAGKESATHSIKEGEVSVTYERGTSKEEGLEALLTRLTKPSKSELARYRRVSF